MSVCQSQVALILPKQIKQLKFETTKFHKVESFQCVFQHVLNFPGVPICCSNFTVELIGNETDLLLKSVGLSSK